MAVHLNRTDLCLYAPFCACVSMCVDLLICSLSQSPTHPYSNLSALFFFQVTYVFQTSIEFLMKVMVTGNGHVHKCTCTFCMPALSG